MGLQVRVVLPVPVPLPIVGGNPGVTNADVLMEDISGSRERSTSRSRPERVSRGAEAYINAINTCPDKECNLLFSESRANPLDISKSAGHTAGARPSTEEKHQKGDSRRKTDRGGEKGDSNRNWPRKNQMAGKALGLLQEHNMKILTIQLHPSSLRIEDIKGFLSDLTFLKPSVIEDYENDYININIKSNNPRDLFFSIKNISEKYKNLNNKWIVICEGDNSWNDYTLLDHYDFNQ